MDTYLNRISSKQAEYKFGDEERYWVGELGQVAVCVGGVAQ